MSARHLTGLPLTLTLSPQAGRGDGRRRRHPSFSPFTGGRCRQADEGRMSLLLTFSLNLSAQEARHAPRI